MHTWQLQEAKAKLTQCINEAIITPQIISRRGVPEVIVMSLQSYQELTNSQEDIVSFFQNSSLYDTELDLRRDTSEMRAIEI